jgi:hypothetical protein
VPEQMVRAYFVALVRRIRNSMHQEQKVFHRKA